MIDFGVSEKKQRQLTERMLDCGIEEKDLEEKFTHSSGPGGQHVNKAATCVVLRHMPTGIQVRCQKARGQLLNRYYARVSLCEALEARIPGRKSPEQVRIEKLRKQKRRRKRRNRGKYGGE